MLGRGGLDDAVAEVEHERALSQATQYAIRLGVQRRTAGDQELWVKVALDAPAKFALHLLRSPSERNRRVEPDTVPRP